MAVQLASQLAFGEPAVVEQLVIEEEAGGEQDPVAQAEAAAVVGGKEATAPETAATPARTGAQQALAAPENAPRV